MRVLVAPDSFKGSMTAAEAAAGIARGLRASSRGREVEIDPCPIADGGEGTLDTLLAADPTGEVREVEVTGPLGERRAARWGLLAGGTVGVVELAEAAGLTLVHESRRDPAMTTTRGVGKLIAAAIEAGVERVVLGLGGSATNDGGAGAAQVLGVTFHRADGSVIDEPMRGGLHGEVAMVDGAALHPALRDGRVALEAACDVTNPLCGSNGAAAVYGPQKGATPAQVATLDAGLAWLAEVVGVSGTFAGAGAAGGFGYGAVALLGGRLRPGIELVLEAVGFERRVAAADGVITGEGRLDGQSLSGKAAAGVAGIALRAGRPCVVFAGSVAADRAALEGAGITETVSIGDGLSVAEAMRRGPELIERAATLWADRALTGG
ncbi:MAG: glycerate kinase [Planctomycetota bacterium]